MTELDLLIIGAGGAGLSAAQYGARANLNTLVLEELAPGGQALLIDHLENYPGITEAISGYDFTEGMKTQALNFGAKIESASVTSLKKEHNRFVVETDIGTMSAKACIIATGAKHRLLGVKGEDVFSGRGVSYCATCDGPFFKNKRMFVVGGGDAACDEAMFLSKLASEVILIHRRDKFRAQASLVKRVMDNPKITVRLNSVIEEISGEKKVSSVLLKDVISGSTETVPCDAVFIFAGSEPRIDFLQNNPEIKLDEGKCIITDQRMETSVKGLFAAGDVRATPFRQLIVASGEGAIAAHCAAQYIDEIEEEEKH